MSKLRRQRRGRTRAERIAARIERVRALAREAGVRMPPLSRTGHPPVGWTLRTLYRPKVVQTLLYGSNPLMGRRVHVAVGR